MGDVPPQVRFVEVPALGEIVGMGDFAAQARQAFRNIELALAEVGCTSDHAVKLRAPPASTWCRSRRLPPPPEPVS